MPQDQQRLLALLLLAGVAGAVLFMSMRGPPPPGGEPGPPGIPPLTPEQVAAMRNGQRVRAVPFYQNEERWEMRRDAAGHLKEIVVHRDARVTK